VRYLSELQAHFRKWAADLLGTHGALNSTLPSRVPFVCARKLDQCVHCALAISWWQECVSDSYR